MRIHVTKLRIAAALVAIGAGSGLSIAQSMQPPPRPDGEEGVQVLTRGPVHEGFAETVTFDPEPGIVVQKAPPDAIEETPPDQRPEGANVTWIPGYSAWDDEQKDYVWVSGVWRSPPPGRQWVSGYWGKSQQGFQWTSGYWGDARANVVEYLPEPPETAEIGPRGAPPSADQSWIPGSWAWQQGRYAWRPGYWVAAQQDWDWVPSHYTWSPRGYVYVDGYWDYSVARRGVLFAPVRFDAEVYNRRGFSYSPSVAINVAALTDNLFLRPQYHSYYFGDYYDSSYSDAGFYWAGSYNATHYGYDPIFAHERWEHRADQGWDHRVATEFQTRRDHIEARPPRTLAAQITINSSGQRVGLGGLVIAARLDQLAKNKDSAIRFQPVDHAEKQKLVLQKQEVQKFRAQRQVLETPDINASAHDPHKAFEPTHVTLPKSAIVARPVESLGKDRSPPQKHETPAPDPKIEAKPRVTHSKAAAPQAEPREKPDGDSKEQPNGNSKKKSKDD